MFVFKRIIVLAAGFAIPPASATALEQNFKTLQGEYRLDRFYCNENAVNGIILDGEVKIFTSGNTLEIDCHEIRFNNNSSIVVDGNISINTQRISGPIFIHAKRKGGQVVHPSLPQPEKAKNGADGAIGKDAPPSPNGFLSKFPLAGRIGEAGANAECGDRGQDGKVGARGVDGQKGADISIVVDWIEPGSSIKLITLGLPGSNGQAGQPGGNGGDGGKGGNAGNGSDANANFAPGQGGNGGHGGCAGNGGNGGRGGDGGNGGRGGDITLSFGENSFKLINNIPIDIKNDGGAPGRGAAGGKAGIAGKPGERGERGQGGLGWADLGVPQAKPGLHGVTRPTRYNGSRGYYGVSGKRGAVGNVFWGGTRRNVDDVLRPLLKKTEPQVSLEPKSIKPVSNTSETDGSNKPLL